MIELYLSESFEIVNNLELLIMESEESKSLDENIDDIFRQMHTIKGNSMMMMYENIAELAHKIEDLFDFIRSNEDVKTDYSVLADIVLSAVDYMKSELTKIENGMDNDVEPKEILKSCKEYLESLKFMHPKNSYQEVEKTKEDQKYYIPAKDGGNTGDKYNKFFLDLKYVDGTQMVNIRALTTLKAIENFAVDIYNYPKDIIKAEVAKIIESQGLKLIFKTEEEKLDVDKNIQKIAFMDSYDLIELTEKEYDDKRILFENDEVEAIKENSVINDKNDEEKVTKDKSARNKKEIKNNLKNLKSQNISRKNSNIKVSVQKIDRLMDLVGELVVSESMLHEERNVLNIDENISKAESQLSRVVNEMQEAVMSIRMVPLKLTFQKMKRIVRDASKKVGKEINLKIIGGDTEVDKNVIEKLGDPLMHIIRNSVDHGIESSEVRLNYNKPAKGNITLQAKQTAGHVVITIQDDGGGLDPNKILDKAEKKELLFKPREDYTKDEIYNLLFEPGFSTNDSVTELSGRGVGLDVVRQNIQGLNGSVSVKSEIYKGTQFIIKIPLTLAIINGVLMDVSNHTFILPTVSIIESYAIKDQKVFENGDGNEMVMIRNEAYPLIRLNQKLKINNKKDLENGIITMIENDKSKLLLHSDEILGKRQVVVKNMSNFLKKVDGISGCALLGDGRISFILNPSELTA